MTDTADKSPFESGAPFPNAETNSETTVTELSDKTVSDVQAYIQRLHDELSDVRAERRQFQQRLDQVTRENKKMKQSPNLIATVEECLADQQLILRQHGNNQEVVTEVTKEVHAELEPQDRVAANESLNVIQRLPDETDAQTQAMTVQSDSGVRYSDIGGLDDQLREVRESVETPLVNPELFESVGISPPRGVLLHGPPGTGKTLIAKAVADSTNATFVQLSGSSLARKFVGEGARLVRNLFETARDNEPAVIFIDEIDAIGTSREGTKSGSNSETQRTLMQLMAEMDGFDDMGNVSIIGATNRVDRLDGALTRPGRFDRLVEIPAPDHAGRVDIFDIHMRDMNIDADVSASRLAEMVADDTTGAQIQSVCTEAGMFAIRDERNSVSLADFERADNKVTPDDSDTVSADVATDVAFE